MKRNGERESERETVKRTDIDDNVGSIQSRQSGSTTTIKANLVVSPFFTVSSFFFFMSLTMQL